MEHRARKRFGQNFLHDRNIIERIVNALNPQAGEPLLEIGPGLGALTLPVIQRCKQLTAIELDRDVIPILERDVGPHGELRIINQDVLKADFREIAGERKLRVYGNLPYNISSPLLFHLFDHLDVIQDMLFMLQKEVVERMTAVADDDAYGRLSVTVQYHCEPTHLFNVPPGAFRPAPKVDSAIVRLVPRKEKLLSAEQEPIFAKLVSAAFSARRKTLRNVWKEQVSAEQFVAANIDSGLRPENLFLQDYLRMTRIVSDAG